MIEKELPEKKNFYEGWKRLTKEEEKEAIRNNDREKLIKSYIPLAKRLAHRYSHLIERKFYEDFLQEGIIGVIDGVDGFDPERGFQLATYLELTIRKKICRYISSKLRMIRIPEHICWRAGEAGKLLNQYGIEGALEKVNEETPYGRSLKKALILIDSGMMLNELNKNPNIKVEEIKSCDGRDEDIRETDVITQNKIAVKLFSNLTKQQRDIVCFKLAYGLSFSEIGERYKFSRQRAQQIYVEGMNKIKEKKIQLGVTDE